MIAVTGINGFIGSSLHRYLCNIFFDVCGLSTNPRQDNIIKLVDGVPQSSIQDLKQVIHCGGLIGNGFHKADYLYANVECTRNLLNWCEKQRVEHFLFFSTGAVYEPRKDWVDENAVLNPIGAYAESKLIAERLVLQSSIPIKTIIRLYFPIGGLQDKHVFSRMAHSIQDGKPVFVNNQQGHPYISPIYIYDVCRITELMILGKLSDTYNLSNNFGIAIGEIIDLIARFYKVQPLKDIKGIDGEFYLGISDKIVAATGYEKFISTQSAINSLLVGEDAIGDKEMENGR
ncbi:MAG: NAD(P)-dependent oxidoreductase [Desulfitobacteriaceae bacterium]